jgi:hypothetical protein
MWVAMAGGRRRPGFLSDARRISKNFGEDRRNPADFRQLVLWIRPLMSRLPEKLLLLALLAALAAGCKPEIGDDCQISTDCSAAGDRLCDITAPGGYCTVYNCEPGACPEDESLCVQFGAERSPNPVCSDPQSPSPYARTFCMAVCEDDDDCREGYVCALLKGANDWNAILIDTDRGDRACLVPLNPNAPAIDDDPTRAGVCHAEAPGSSGSSAGGSSAGGSSAGGAAGSAGEPGAGGMSGAGMAGNAGAEGGAAGFAGAADGGAGE